MFNKTSSKADIIDRILELAKYIQITEKTYKILG